MSEMGRKAAILPEKEEGRQRAERVGMAMLANMFGAIFEMGYEAGQEAATASITIPTKPTKPLVEDRCCDGGGCTCCDGVGRV